MPIACLVLARCHPRYRRLTCFRRIIMTGPDSDVIWHAEQFAPGVEKILGAASGEICSCGSEVGVVD